jgi:3-carboxy-cis,cis-muconate cycloisomerase
MRQSSSISEPAVVDPGFSTHSMSACFSSRARVRALLDVEAALALASADTGVLAPELAEEIAHVCATIDVDADDVLSDGWERGTPVLSLLDVVRPALSPEAAALISHGATTQDIVDTGMQLQIRSALGLIEADLTRLADRLVALAIEHRATPMIGRTFLQHARPTTFGLRTAQWLDPVVSHLVAVRAAQSDCAIQLGGPVGTLDELGLGAGARLAARLDLIEPVTPWHGDRTRIAGVVALIVQLSRTMAKIATDIAILSSSDIAEVRMREGGSSSMAGKRNPIDSVRANAAADACVGAASSVAAARPIELERGIGGWHVEWFTIPIVFMTGAAALDAIVRAIESLEVDAAAMMRNVGEVETGRAVESAARLVDRILERVGPLLSPGGAS